MVPFWRIPGVHCSAGEPINSITARFRRVHPAPFPNHPRKLTFEMVQLILKTLDEFRVSRGNIRSISFRRCPFHELWSNVVKNEACSWKDGTSKSSETSLDVSLEVWYFEILRTHSRTDQENEGPLTPSIQFHSLIQKASTQGLHHSSRESIDYLLVPLLSSIIEQESTERRRRLKRKQQQPKTSFLANCVMTRCGEIPLGDVALADDQGPTSPKIREPDVIIAQRKTWLTPALAKRGAPSQQPSEQALRSRYT
ncbi:uncharacterized protein CLUP02_06041 [Colletotrichum lupini]|uniref:Uncharacterized protein n=1 Tax=Colletotrichum lupini TaxID=145971 RepID=A0A9Q8WEA6_9PEZI|nr:uncharacterized protein CLUP02_06041 [Colletotrichum lupini]UQC80558.1 hypothetical protein CLUP02_06041 [Colletotrichum lupini]